MQEFIQSVAFAIAIFGVLFIVYYPKVSVVLTGGDMDIKTGAQVSAVDGGSVKAHKMKGSRRKGVIVAGTSERGNNSSGGRNSSGVREGSMPQLGEGEVKDHSDEVRLEKSACLAPDLLARKATYAEMATLCDGQIEIWRQLLTNEHEWFSTSHQNSEGRSASQMPSSVNVGDEVLMVGGGGGNAGAK